MKKWVDTSPMEIEEELEMDYPKRIAEIRRIYLSRERLKGEIKGEFMWGENEF